MHASVINVSRTKYDQEIYLPLIYIITAQSLQLLFLHLDLHLHSSRTAFLLLATSIGHKHTRRKQNKHN